MHERRPKGTRSIGTVQGDLTENVMRFNPWLVALLAAGPMFILIVGLAAAAEGLGSHAAWIMIGAIVVTGGVAAYKAIDAAGPR